MTKVEAYECDLLDEDGNKCGMLFKDYDQLRGHMNSNAHR
jgi:hypothetical protein